MIRPTSKEAADNRNSLFAQHESIVPEETKHVTSRLQFAIAILALVICPPTVRQAQVRTFSKRFKVHVPAKRLGADTPKRTANEVLENEFLNDVPHGINEPSRVRAIDDRLKYSRTLTGN